jgi:hypothetical protein
VKYGFILVFKRYHAVYIKYTFIVGDMISVMGKILKSVRTTSKVKQFEQKVVKVAEEVQKVKCEGLIQQELIDTVIWKVRRDAKYQKWNGRRRR